MQNNFGQFFHIQLNSNLGLMLIKNTNITIANKSERLQKINLVKLFFSVLLQSFHST